MTFAELKQELSDRGFSYLTDARLGRYINTAGRELLEADQWSFRELATSSSADSTYVSTDGPPYAVVWYPTPATATNYYQLTYRSAGDAHTTPGYAATGAPPCHYTLEYSTNTGGYHVIPLPQQTSIGAGQMAVWYYAPWTDLTGATEPLVPPPANHSTIVDIAARIAYRDSDNHDAAESLQVQIDRDVNRMRMTYGVVAHGPDTFIRTTERW